MEFKKRLKLDDPPDPRRATGELCGPSIFGTGYGDFVPEPYRVSARTRRRASAATSAGATMPCERMPGSGGWPGEAQGSANVDDLVRMITDNVMASLAGSRV